MDAMACQQSKSVGAYHDGELPPAAREQFESHLPQCSACAGELGMLRAVSRALREAELPNISAAALARLHGAMLKHREAAEPAFNERAVLRLAEWLTGAAAAVLVAGLVGLFRDTPTSASALAPLPWEQAAVTLQHEPQGQDPTQFVEWQPSDVP